MDTQATTAALSGDKALARVEEALIAAVAEVDPHQLQALAATDTFRHAFVTRLSQIWPSECDKSLFKGVLAHALPSTCSAHGLSPALEAALGRSNDVFGQALLGAGMSSRELSLLQAWFNVQLQAREIHQQATWGRLLEVLAQNGALGAATPQVLGDDPMRGLSAVELGLSLGNRSDETVRQRERAGELFSVLRPGRKRGREYPAFQAWPGVAGAPLQQVLARLTGLSPTDLYGFFAGITDLLDGLTPVEALVGKLIQARTVDDAARELLGSAGPDRLDAVLQAADAYAALRAA
ncbi:MAG: hypothetical protein E6R08_09005 [Nevskiaceae bacterium]|nr:MAG: hypothetical protein E6R08_09005 [Nevskiaceae bacterium]